MSKLVNKEIKELLKKVNVALNDYSQYEIDNGHAWGYKLKLKRNEIECRIYEEIECENCNYVITIPNENITGIKDILKCFINEIYEKEINWRNSCLKSNKGWYSRKHKSINLWLTRGKEDKILEISKQIAERYSNSKRLENEVEHFKVFISRFYYALNMLVPTWKVEDIKETTFKRLNEFNIKNVGISCIDNKLIIMKNSEDANAVLDKFDIQIDSYSNSSMVVNQIVNRLGKVA
ncbi:hypothetical protein [Inconstantimicrobium mannanitabidum]|uniref:Uncharacterized protein n=1 Tax=Inconstantimicrobium mannanitabidum TaxID=1604901 RepID=A0ACB5R9V0_9CLOT|nr:hypothetical protein [Clostridium sp. TW13]GKX65816.1 hypothetical protein rsdtw13_10740 [Clostridium sp. TW13]